MDSNSRGILLGVLLGVAFVIGLAYAGVTWSSERLKTASLPVDPPILFQPK